MIPSRARSTTTRTSFGYFLGSHFLSPDGRVKRDLLHSSFGTKYAPRQTPWPALERNPMHFIRGQVIQSRRIVGYMGCVYSRTPPLRHGSPVAPLWTQSNPGGPSQLSSKTSNSLSLLLLSSCLVGSAHFLFSCQPSGYTNRHPSEKGSGTRGGEAMFARRKWRPLSVQHSFVPEGFYSQSQGSYTPFGDRYRWIRVHLWLAAHGRAGGNGESRWCNVIV